MIDTGAVFGVIGVNMKLSILIDKLIDIKNEVGNIDTMIASSGKVFELHSYNINVRHTIPEHGRLIVVLGDD